MRRGCGEGHGIAGIDNERGPLGELAVIDASMRGGDQYAIKGGDGLARPLD